ncbi:hypothetical protein ABZ671_04440 [Micromonospora sp. NPDC006766]|uniref:hypothetical protein n=1 Tax=Micromonospora sp. NPDC006766 TaxID=3154778 RepID=UPI0033F2BDC5
MTINDVRAAGRTAYPWLRSMAVTASLLLFGYGLLRLIGGLGGHRDKSAWPWMIGHTLFLFGIVAFGAVIVGLHGLLRATSSPLRAVDDVAAVAGLLGAVGFGWVILGDLFPRFADAVNTPGLVLAGGPALFELGLLTLLFRAAFVRLLPIWGPVLVLVGFASIAVQLDLLPIGAALVLAGLLPLGGSRPR